MTQVETEPVGLPEEGLLELRKRLGENVTGDLMVTEAPCGDVAKKNRLNIPRPPALPMGPLLNPEGLIVPRKPLNPCLDSKDRQDLHRELMFNQKIGKNVLNQKSELQRALEKHRDHQVKKEMELEKNQNKTLLERVIEERAKKLEHIEKKEENISRVPEFMQVHAKVRGNKDNNGK